MSTFCPISKTKAPASAIKSFQEGSANFPTKTQPNEVKKGYHVYSNFLINSDNNYWYDYEPGRNLCASSAMFLITQAFPT